MKRYKSLCECLLIAMLMGSLVGCKASSETVEETAETVPVYTGPTSMEDTPVIDYELPEIYPNILINRMGYSAEGTKEAVIVGEDLPVQFSLIEVETEEVVYEGIINNLTYDENKQLYAGRANFSDYVKEGTYFLECDTLGQSYTFSIQKDMYEQLFFELYEEILKDCKDQNLKLEDVMALLTAYEWYPPVFKEGDSRSGEDMMEVLADWFSLEIPMAERESSLYVAALAKMGYLYQDVDAQQGSQWIQRSANIFAGIQKTAETEADYFYALTELYRATGWNTYRYQIIEYTDFFDDSSVYLGEPSYLYGAMTYMTTKQRVNVPLCNIFYADIENKGINIAETYEYMINPLENPDSNVEGLSARAKELFCCNYLLNNYEYTHIIEEFLDFWMGQNLKSVAFYPEEGEKSTYFLLLTQLVAEKMDEG